MNRQNLYGASLIIAAATLTAQAQDKPNIVLLLADDQQAYALGCMGNKEIFTPNLDKLAANGLVFDRAYATSSICMPARATIMTGMYEFKTGCNFGTGKMRTSDWRKISYPMLLKKNGYFIGFAGKWGIASDEDMHYEQDFDMWGGFEGHGQGSYHTDKNKALTKYAEKYPHVTRALGAFGQDFIKDAVKTGKPFSLSISFKAPHKPHNFIDSEAGKLYEEVAFSKRSNYGDKFAEKLPSQALLGRQRAQWSEWCPEAYQTHLKAYYQLISGIDTAVGMIVKQLKESGVLNKTVIIYTSDNGYALGSHGLQGKCLPYEESSRVPLIIVDPRSSCKGKRTNTLVGNIDIAPTILGFAGIEVPKRMDGKSLLPLLNSPSMKIHNNIMLIQNWGTNGSETNKALSVLTDKFKYIYWPYGDKNMKPAEELYNISDDPLEQNNILKTSSQSPEVLGELQKIYDKNLDFWVENAANNNYLRHKILFNRTIPWQDKKFVMPKRYVSREMYENIVGKEPPPGFLSETKFNKVKTKTKKN